MKRSIVAICLSVLSVATTGCSREPVQAQGRAAESGWILPPSIETAQRRGSSLFVEGRAAPEGRIVLRGAGSTAYAVSADESGHFAVRVDLPSTDTLFVVETQSGQVGAPAPYRLLVSADPSGPIALVGSGVASLRLDSKSVLDVVDGDRRSSIASGHMSPNLDFEVKVNDETRSVRPDALGRWSSTVNVPIGMPITIEIAGQVVVVPASDSSAGTQLLRRQGQGWRFVWSISPGIVQVSWFPDRRVDQP